MTTTTTKTINWIDLTSIWETLRAVAKKRDDQKRKFATSRYLNPDSHFHGLLAEHIFGLETGQNINLELLIEGDGGQDFPGTDVKGATYWTNPSLILFTDDALRANKYALVALDIEGKRGYLVGYATREEVQKAEIRDFGYGPRLSISADKLHDWNEEVVANLIGTI